MSTSTNMIAILKNDVVINVVQNIPELENIYPKNEYVYIDIEGNKIPHTGWTHNGIKFIPNEIPDYANAWDYENWCWEITHYKKVENNG